VNRRDADRAGSETEGGRDRSRRRMSANSQLSHLAHETVARGARIFLAGEHDLPYNRGIDI
jgi:hypothetical protein